MVTVVTLSLAKKKQAMLANQRFLLNVSRHKRNYDDDDDE